MQVAKEDVEEGIIPTMASRCIISQSQEEVVVAKIVASMIETITKKVNIVKEIVVMMTVLTWVTKTRAVDQTILQIQKDKKVSLLKIHV